MKTIKPKTEEEIKIMEEGGALLGEIRRKLAQAVAPGVSAWEIELLARDLIKKTGGVPSFQMVPGYSWALCVNVNDGVVHGIPHKETVFKSGDVVSIDVGLYYKGLHTDTAETVYLGSDPQIKRFLDTGRAAVNAAIMAAVAGNKVRDIARAYEVELKKGSCNPIWNLTGHGVGKKLHESPYIPCFVSGSADESITLEAGNTLALEVMYTLGSGETRIDSDGWTMRTKDAKLAALFEHSVVVREGEAAILTP